MLLAIGLTESRLLSSCHVLNPWAHREQGLLLSSSVNTCLGGFMRCVHS